ncbi:YiiX/YebB-like N1pC/P60 family cysteine hydrolase [Clostridiaceae bacterium M8S5]|nr:YiiX/YebB-like N1pC/P60 family cysteine hydrolase [Clostridiaceae bacterium M8S5]
MKLFKFLLVLLVVLSLCVPVLANDQFTFNENELLKDWEKADATTVRADHKNLNDFACSASTKSFGNYPTRKGVILVTKDKYKGLIKLGHAAIIWSTSTVVESHSSGVSTGRNDWNVTRKTCYGVTPYDTNDSEDAQAANWCYQQIGKPYNFNFLNKRTRDKFYCSQLVYAAYKDLFDLDLDTASYLTAIHPVELINTNKTYTIYEQ